MLSLQRHRRCLPVLKEAGVVDSGGQGLVQVLKGAYDAFLGKEIDYTVEPAESTKKAPAQEKEAPAQAEIRVRLLYRIYHHARESSIHRRRSRSSKDFWSPSVIPSLLCRMKMIVKGPCTYKRPWHSNLQSTHLRLTDPYQNRQYA